MAAISSHLSKDTYTFSLNAFPLPYDIFFLFKLIVSTQTHFDLCLLFWWYLPRVWWPLAIDLCSKIRHKEVVWRACVIRQNCHLAACRGIRCWAALSLGGHTPSQLSLCMSTSPGAMEFFHRLHSGLLQFDGVGELGLRNKPGTIVGAGRLMGAHQLACPRARDAGQFLLKRNSVFYTD